MISLPLSKHELDSIIRVNLLQLTLIKTKPNLLPACGIGKSKGAFKYYVIRLGGVGGLDQNDDNDDAFRGGGGLGLK